MAPPEGLEPSDLDLCELDRGAASARLALFEAAVSPAEAPAAVVEEARRRLRENAVCVGKLGEPLRGVRVAGAIGMQGPRLVAEGSF